MVFIPAGTYGVGSTFRLTSSGLLSSPAPLAAWDQPDADPLGDVMRAVRDDRARLDAFVAREYERFMRRHAPLPAKAAHRRRYGR